MSRRSFWQRLAQRTDRSPTPSQQPHSTNFAITNPDGSILIANTDMSRSSFTTHHPYHYTSSSSSSSQRPRQPRYASPLTPHRELPPAELAGMMGMSDPAAERRGRDSDINHDRNDTGLDDPLDGVASSTSYSRGSQRGDYGGSMGLHGSPSSRSLTYDSHESQHPQRQQAMVQPTIRVRPEYNTIYRKDPTGQNGKQNMVCVITIEIPSRRPPLSPEEEEAKLRQQWSSLQSIHGRDRDSAFNSTDQDTRRHSRASSAGAAAAAAATTTNNGNHSHSNDTAVNDGQDTEVDTADATTADAGKDSDAGSQHGGRLARGEGSGAASPEEGFSYGATPAASDVDPNAAVLEDLRARITDWKGQGLEKFGSLVLYDSLGVRQDAVVRNFWVYCGYRRAMLCG